MSLVVPDVVWVPGEGLSSGTVIPGNTVTLWTRGMTLCHVSAAETQYLRLSHY